MGDKLEMRLLDQIRIDPVNNPKSQCIDNHNKWECLHFSGLVNNQCVENQMINIKNSAKSVNLCKHPIGVFNKVNSSPFTPSKGGQKYAPPSDQVIRAGRNPSMP
jgi:hypothetical protein